MSINTTYSHYTTPIKSFLIRRNWDKAIDLLDLLVKHEPKAFEQWVRKGSTIALRRMAERFRNWSLYTQVRNRENLAFENDVDALDTAWLHTLSGRSAQC